MFFIVGTGRIIIKFIANNFISGVRVYGDNEIGFIFDHWYDRIILAIYMLLGAGACFGPGIFTFIFTSNLYKEAEQLEPEDDSDYS